MKKCLLLVAAASVFSCKPRATTSALRDDTATGGAAGVSGLKDFDLEPTGAFVRKLGARLQGEHHAAGCVHAARLVITGNTGRKKTSWKQHRGDLVASIQTVVQSGRLNWDMFEEWVLLPTYSYLACTTQTSHPQPAEIPGEILAALKTRAATLKQAGLKLTFVVASSEEAAVAKGVATSVKAALSGSEVGYKEVALSGIGGLDELAQKARQDLQKDLGDNDAVVIWAYGIAGAVAVEAMAGEEAAAKALRNRTALLVTVGSPIGGALPAVAAQVEVTKAFDRIRKRFDIMGLQSADDAVYKAVMKPAAWLHPNERASYLATKLKNASFALSRSGPQQRLGDKLNIAHVAAIQDPGNLRFFPRIGDGEAAKLGLGDITSQLLTPVYQTFPLSDGIVALEHAVIPKRLAPQGVDVRLLGVLRMGHWDLALAGPDTSTKVGRDLARLHEVPVLAIVDALLAAGFEAIDKNEVPEVEPPYDPEAERISRLRFLGQRDGFRIRSKYSNMCLDVPDPNGSHVYAHPCHNDRNQRWVMDKVHGMVTFRSMANPQNCVDAHHGDKEKKKGFLYMHPCHLQHNQLFYFGRRPDGVVNPDVGMLWSEIHNQLYANSKCMDIDTDGRSAPNGNKNGRRVYMHTDCHGGENQQWIIEAVGQ